MVKGRAQLGGGAFCLPSCLLLPGQLWDPHPCRLHHTRRSCPAPLQGITPPRPHILFPSDPNGEPCGWAAPPLQATLPGPRGHQALWTPPRGSEHLLESCTVTPWKTRDIRLLPSPLSLIPRGYWVSWSVHLGQPGRGAGEQSPQGFPGSGGSACAPEGSSCSLSTKAGLGYLHHNRT